jgi:hypothetical protein
MLDMLLKNPHEQMDVIIIEAANLLELQFLVAFSEQVNIFSQD